MTSIAPASSTAHQADELLPESDMGIAEVPVENPVTGAIIATVPEFGVAEVRNLARKGREAQPGWQALGFDGRSRIMLRARKWLLDNAERVVETIVSETGKTWEDAQLAELSYTAEAFGFWAKHAERYLAEERVRTASLLVKGRKLVVRYEPLGLIGVIGPWNFPLVNSVGDAIPALMAGNAVILKPSELTPLTSLLMADALRACGMPENIFQVATGGGGTGSALIDQVDMVMFTGSTRTGRKVMQRAAETLTPVSLELGGKDPMIVLADANLERAANAATFYSMQNGGQACIAVERVYVEATVYEQFVDKVTQKVRALRQGDPSGGPGSVDVGAVTFPAQLDTIEAHVRDAVDKGARVVVGGHRRQTPRGRFYEPTVLVDVDHSMDAMTDETFGPILPIMRVRDAEEAIRLANDSKYGLAASIYTADRKRGEQLARRIKTGSVAVNDALLFYFALDVPMGGRKESGLGSRHGAVGIRKYCAEQTVLVSPLSLNREPFMFPNRRRTTRMLLMLARLVWGRAPRGRRRGL